MAFVKAGFAGHRAIHRNFRQLSQLSQLGGGLCHQYTHSRPDERLLRLEQHAYRVLDRPRDGVCGKRLGGW